MRLTNHRSAATSDPGVGPAALAVAGVDGCRGGWVVVITGIEPGSPSTVAVVPDIAPVTIDLGSGRLAAVGIDMPIGLAADGHRAADVAARRLLGARRSALFPTPPLDVLGATDYADALARCRAASGKGLSIQAFNLLPKMRELASRIEPSMQPRLSEVHPETSFAVVRGEPCAEPKRTPGGSAERRDALREHFVDLDDLMQTIPRGAKPDDVLDAFAAAWTARRVATGRALVLGDDDERDARGYRLTISV
ncbi:MAG: DUF429 domain-containing protein [Actinobacteria bacterium]|nr:DUF429 domain-containing protein [Actinomycetota bacterium]MSW92157.1 DUF429 domain-containing protein [Actinomycetota bacterium]MSY70736.1 DUF429 domain-containing protein [Actinomycetota bacterium]